MSIKSCSSTVTDATTDSVMFAEDRSDKSQYVANPVMRQSEAVIPPSVAVDGGLPPKSNGGASLVPGASSRLDNYRLQVSRSTDY
jgi:hypothetical protein